jgi:hypothetical protein
LYLQQEAMENTNAIAQLGSPDETIMNQIYIIREQKVMIDKDLAILYGVETRVLKQAIKRNIDRFPKDFMFELSAEEANSLVLQAELSDLKVLGGAKPLVFTEQGVAMLSSILNSATAIKVNIQILRIFVKMRHLLTDQLSIRLEIAEIKDKLQHQDKKQDNQNKNIEIIFQYLDELQNKLDVIEKPNKKIGFKPEWV